MASARMEHPLPTTSAVTAMHDLSASLCSDLAALTKGGEGEGRVSPEEVVTHHLRLQLPFSAYVSTINAAIDPASDGIIVAARPLSRSRTNDDRRRDHDTGSGQRAHRNEPRGGGRNGRWGCRLHGPAPELRRERVTSHASQPW
jgi:hypothetical protein